MYALALCGWLRRLGRDSLWPEGGKAGVIFLMKGFFIPTYRLFPHIFQVFFFLYTGRVVTMVSSDNLRIRPSTLGWLTLARTPNAFFNRCACTPAIRAAVLYCRKGDSQGALTSNIMPPSTVFHTLGYLWDVFRGLGTVGPLFWGRKIGR